MQSALHPDSEQGKEWMESLASITQPKTNEIISHGLAKQIFWLAGDDPYEDEDFVLLQPFFSSALSHQVYQQIREDKFGEAATEARKAREKNLPSERSLKVYIDMGVQHLGGTKPQNISYLNSVQRGANYLLSSCPPLWGASSLKPILFQENAFNRFGWKNSARDRKSTRLNSSHVAISYAVFCLKKKSHLFNQLAEGCGPGLLNSYW